MASGLKDDYTSPMLLPVIHCNLQFVHVHVHSTYMYMYDDKVMYLQHV